MAKTALSIRCRLSLVRNLRHVGIAATSASVDVDAHRRRETPKGRTRRVVPMTPPLHAALKALQVFRTGHVLRNADGSPVSDSQARDAMYRICRLAGLPERGWHVLRHSFGTHAAMLG